MKDIITNYQEFPVTIMNECEKLRKYEENIALKASQNSLREGQRNSEMMKNNEEIDSNATEKQNNKRKSLNQYH